jgi:peptidyl-prolyl cis-trans isomerase D
MISCQINIRTCLAKAYYVPEVLAKKDFYAKNRQASILTLALRYQTIPDDEVEISEKEVKRYYDDNKFRYKQEASRGN